MRLLNVFYFIGSESVSRIWKLISHNVPVSRINSLAFVASTHSSDLTHPLAPVLMASAEAVRRKFNMLPNKFFLEFLNLKPSLMEQTLSLVAYNFFAISFPIKQSSNIFKLGTTWKAASTSRRFKTSNRHGIVASVVTFNQLELNICLTFKISKLNNWYLWKFVSEADSLIEK